MHSEMPNVALIKVLILRSQIWHRKIAHYVAQHTAQYVATISCKIPSNMLRNIMDIEYKGNTPYTPSNQINLFMFFGSLVTMHLMSLVLIHPADTLLMKDVKNPKYI